VGSRRQDLIVWDLSESKGRNIRNLLQIHRDSYKTHMGVSINGSTPKWMAYSMENPKLKWMIWRYLHILVVKIESRFNNPKAAPRSSWPPSPIDRDFHELQRVPVRHVEVVDWWMDFGLVWT
jgi:hypothetical protein